MTAPAPPECHPEDLEANPDHRHPSFNNTNTMDNDEDEEGIHHHL